jgi:hypothetical protein
MFILILLALTLLVAAAGVSFLVSMIVRDEPVLGVVGLMLLCGAGLTGAAYGLVSSTS